MIQLAHKSKLAPTKEQLNYLKQSGGATRFVWNWGLDELNETHKRNEKFSTDILRKKFDSIKQEQFPWLVERVSSYAVQRVWTDLNTAHQRFFKKVSRRPVFKSKRDRRDSFYITNQRIKLIGDSIKVPKLDEPIEMCHPPDRFVNCGRVMSATFSCDTVGDWYVSLSYELDERYVYPHKCKNPDLHIGIDLGLTTMATLSNGEKIENPRVLWKHEKKLKRLQRVLSRRQKGTKEKRPSNRYERARVTLAKKHRKVQRIRHSYLHRVTAKLVENYGRITIEDLRVKNMLKNHCLAKSISDVSWGLFRSMLTYKATLSGSLIIVADTYFPSSKLCSCCGHKLSKLSLSQREWTCPKCGTVHDRDVNAAVNIDDYVALESRETQNARGETQDVSLQLMQFQ